MTRRKRLLLFALIPAGVLLLIVMFWPYIFAHVFVFALSADISRIEREICKPANYQPAGTALAVLSTFAMATIDGRNLPKGWRPDSLAALDALSWYAGPDAAGVLFTGGFSHLSYRLEKNETESTQQEAVWDLYFDDEGRRKYLNRIIVTQADHAAFDGCIASIIEAFDRQIAKDPSSVELAERKTNFLLAAGIADGYIPSDDERQYLETAK